MVRGLEVSRLAGVQESDVSKDFGGCFVLKAVIMLSTKGLQYGLSIHTLSAIASSTYNCKNNLNGFAIKSLIIIVHYDIRAQSNTRSKFKNNVICLHSGHETGFKTV